jgi:hypothetical protein
MAGICLNGTVGRTFSKMSMSETLQSRWDIGGSAGIGPSGTRAFATTRPKRKRVEENFLNP